MTQYCQINTACCDPTDGAEDEAESYEGSHSTPRHPKRMKDDQNDQEVEEEGYPVQHMHEGSDKDRCPSNICKMKKPNSRTWWVSCGNCDQWFHIRCVNLTKKKAQNESFTCENC